MKTRLKKLADPLARLFWRAVIRFMRICPLVSAMIGDGAFRAYNGRIRGLFPIAAQVPRALLLRCRDILKKRVALNLVYIGVTTRCTLNCDKCSMYLSFLRHRGDAPADELLSDIQALLSCVDHIYDFCIGGGEPFLHPDLDRIIRACAASGKIGKIRVLTNGTVLPGANVLAALREAGVRVNIGQYQPALQSNIDTIKAVLTENGISHFVFPATDYWIDTGSFGEPKEGPPDRRFRVCYQRLYTTFISGQLHLCPQSAALGYDGRLPEGEGDFIDIRAIEPAAFRGAWNRLNKRGVVSACSYCLGHSYQTPKIPAAVQRDGIST